MAYKFIAIIACAAVASAALLPVRRLEQAEEYDSHPSYSFSYEVQDSDTGDFKSQSETREGDAVQGQYSLQDADGYQRIVEYSVNGESGFNAVVRREPLNSADASVARAQAALAEPAPAPVPTAAAAAPAPTTAPKAAPPKPAAAPLSPPALLKPFKLQAAYVQPAAYYRTAYAAPTTVLHHAPAHTVIHSAPSLHLAPAATHFLHAAPSTTLLKSHPAVITHHAPAVVRTSFASPHYQYVY